PRLMLVYDKSTSMFAPGFDDGQGGTTSHWAALHGVTASLVDNYDPAFALGTQLVPQSGTTTVFSTTTCDVSVPPDVEVGQQTGEQVLATIPSASSTASTEGGATPTGSALSAAYDHLLASRELAPEIPSYAVVVTDGAANCRPDLVESAAMCGGDFSCNQVAINTMWDTYDDATPGHAADARDQGIVTFVIGLNIQDFDPLSNLTCTTDADCPAGTVCCDSAAGDLNCPIDGTCAQFGGAPKDVNPTQALADLAAAGGHPNPPSTGFYDVTDAVQLEAAFDDVLATIRPCDVHVDPALDPEAQHITVMMGDQGYGDCLSEYGEEPIPNCVPALEDAAACAVSDGVLWSVPGETFTLCGAVCDAFVAAGALEVVAWCREPHSPGTTGP
ncbi:MAG: VWA domain-containing protein, partial [Nannocystaceae bacterium]